jgi:hypothetical protein
MIRVCKLCGKEVDFSEPWCDHETMEESAWLDIHERIYKAAVDKTIDDLVHKTAKELNLNS